MLKGVSVSCGGSKDCNTNWCVYHLGKRVLNSEEIKMSNEKKQTLRLKLKGLAMYARVHTPQKAFKPTEPSLYTMDLLCTKEEAQKALSLGVKRAKTKKDEDTKVNKSYEEHPGLVVFTLTNPTKNRDGSTRTPPRVVDGKGNDIPKTVLIGNGSEVIAHIDVYETEAGTGKRLVGLQVLKLVPFEGGKRELDLDEVEDSFDVTQHSSNEGTEEATDNTDF